MVDQFEEANPDVTVEITSLPWGQAFEKLATMVQGGQIPDVVEMPDRWLSLYANNDQLVDLSPYMADWDEAEELTDRTVEFGSYVDNTPYMIPYGFYLRAHVLQQEAVRGGRARRAARDHGRLHGGIQGDQRARRRQDRLLPARRPGRRQRLHHDDGQHDGRRRLLRRGRATAR